MFHYICLHIEVKIVCSDFTAQCILRGGIAGILAHTRLDSLSAVYDSVVYGGLVPSPYSQCVSRCLSDSLVCFRLDYRNCESIGSCAGSCADACANGVQPSARVSSSANGGLSCFFSVSLRQSLNLSAFHLWLCVPFHCARVDAHR